MITHPRVRRRAHTGAGRMQRAAAAGYKAGAPAGGGHHAEGDEGPVIAKRVADDRSTSAEAPPPAEHCIVVKQASCGGGRLLPPVGAMRYWCHSLLAAAGGGPHGVSSMEPIEVELRLPHQLQAAVGQCRLTTRWHRQGMGARLSWRLWLRYRTVVYAAGQPALPPWGSGMCVMEYAPRVAAALAEHCVAAAWAARLRQALLEALLAMGLLRTLELDSITLS
ncbi:hypothetical protein WJX81_002651 [Elliptochloris bilobata]|uniref:Uncharacterized protein n=1 Tax=Elliptochloris bilobata TaxID=381761 RepID=A0AAW1QCD0_9CHLO